MLQGGKKSDRKKVQCIHANASVYHFHEGGLACQVVLIGILPTFVSKSAKSAKPLLPPNPDDKSVRAGP